MANEIRTNLTLDEANQYLVQIAQRLNEIITQIENGKNVDSKEKPTAWDLSTQAKGILNSSESVGIEAFGEIYEKLYNIYQEAKTRLDKLKEDNPDVVNTDKNKNVVKEIEKMAKTLKDKREYEQANAFDGRKLIEELEKVREKLIEKIEQEEELLKELKTLRRKVKRPLKRIIKNWDKVEEIKTNLGISSDVKNLDAIESEIERQIQEAENKIDEKGRAIGDADEVTALAEVREWEEKLVELKGVKKEFSRLKIRINKDISDIKEKVNERSQIVGEYIRDRHGLFEEGKDVDVFKKFYNESQNEPVKEEKEGDLKKLDDLTRKIEDLKKEERKNKRGQEQEAATQQINGAQQESILRREGVVEQTTAVKSEKKEKKKKKDDKQVYGCNDILLKHMTLAERRENAKKYEIARCKWFGSRWFVNIKYSIPLVRNIGIKSWEKKYLAEANRSDDADSKRNYIDAEKEFKKHLTARVAGQSGTPRNFTQDKIGKIYTEIAESEIE